MMQITELSKYALYSENILEDKRFPTISTQWESHTILTASI